MDIGKPRRIYRIEPLKEPVPAKRERTDKPAAPAPGPAKAPAR